MLGPDNPDTLAVAGNVAVSRWAAARLCRTAAADAGSRLVLIDPSLQVMRVLEMTGLLDLFGRGGEQFIRLCFARDPAQIAHAVRAAIC